MPEHELSSRSEGEVVLAEPSSADRPAGPPPGVPRHGGTRRGLFPPRTRRARLAIGAVVVGLLMVIALITLPLVSHPDGVQPAAGPAGVHWQLQFDENFSGDTAAVLGSDSWHSGWFGNGQLTAPVNSQEKSLLTRANLSVAGGMATLDVTPNSAGHELPGGRTEPNLGAALNTDDEQAADGFMMGYGYAEARMQLPAGAPGERVWPSFWLTGHTWPDDMEIDVVEGDGTDQGCKFNIHHGSHGRDTTNLNSIVRKRTVPGATTGMHTYGADIRPDGVTFYYDGTAVYSYKGHVPDKQRYLMVGISAAGPVTTKHSLVVDYVRAWTRS
jgi:Glycosyl hydrolases family 16